MTLETDPAILSRYSDDEWEALLARAMVEPRPPRSFVFVHEWASPLGLKGEARRAYVLKRFSEGALGREIAKELNLDITSISKIRKGTR